MQKVTFSMCFFSGILNFCTNYVHTEPGKPQKITRKTILSFQLGECLIKISTPTSMKTMNSRNSGYTKLFTHLHPLPPISTNLPPTSIHLPIPFTPLHPPSSHLYLPPPTSMHLSITSTHLYPPPLTLGISFCQSFSFISFLLYFLLEASFTKIMKLIQNRIALESFTRLCIFVLHHIFKQRLVK